MIGTETWWDRSIKNNEIFPGGYKIYRKDRKRKVCGGVIIAIKNNFLSDEVDHLSPENKCEITWARLELKAPELSISAHSIIPNHPMTKVHNCSTNLSEEPHKLKMQLCLLVVILTCLGGTGTTKALNHISLITKYTIT